MGAGSGTRLGSSQPKAFVPVAGRPALSRALDAVFEMREAAQLILVVPATYIPVTEELVTAVPGYDGRDVTIIEGGASRQDSVSAAFDHLAPTVEAVLVHDAARPLVPAAVFDAVAETVLRSGVAAIPGLPVADTIKRTDAAGRVVETLDRSKLTAVQTPQGFPREQLLAAHASARGDFTDDAAMVAAAGHPVEIVAGDHLSFKITTAWELRQAERLFAAPSGSDVRVGTGTDVHAFDASKPLWLAGLFWPDEIGLAGHSDGDAVAHAICDALLAAAALGDVGSVFGTSDPRFAEAHGDVFVTEAVRLVRDAGFDVRNVSVQVIANHPKISRRRAEAERALSDLVGAPVSLSATTSDALGFTGRGEGAAAIATALISAR